MKEIIALQNYSDQYVSLYEGQIRIIEANLANRLIAKGIAAEHDEISACCYDPNSAPSSTSTSVQSNIISVNIEDREDADGFILLMERETLLSEIEAGKTIFAKYTTTTGTSPYLRRQNDIYILSDSYPAMQGNILVYHFIFTEIITGESQIDFHADQSRTYPISTTITVPTPSEDDTTPT